MPTQAIADLLESAASWYAPETVERPQDEASQGNSGGAENFGRKTGEAAGVAAGGISLQMSGDDPEENSDGEEVSSGDTSKRFVGNWCESESLLGHSARLGAYKVR